MRAVAAPIFVFASVVAAVLAALLCEAACNVVVVDVPAADADVPPPPPDIPRPDTSDPQVVRGWTAVLQRKCPSCHQAPDAGGILSGGVDPVIHSTAYGANLTPDPDTGLDGWSTDAIVRAMKQGLDVDGIKLCTAMPKFADMGDEEGKAIAAYLHFLPAVHHPVHESLCPPIKVPHEADSGDDAADAAQIDGGATDAAADALDAADG